MERYYYNSDLWYSIPYHLQRDDTRNIAVVHTYTRKRGLKRTIIHRRAQKGQKRKEQRGYE